MDKWEYRWIFNCSISDANALGKLSWELVSVIPPMPGDITKVSKWIFKRKIIQ